MKKMLIVVDMLNDFIRPDGALYVPHAEKIIPAVQHLLAEHRTQRNAIIFLGDSHYPNDEEFKRFPKHCVAGTRGAELIPELELGKTANESFIPKTRFSGFFNTSLHDAIASIGPDEAAVCGVCTSICVMDTIGGLTDRNIPTCIHLDTVHDLPPMPSEHFPEIQIDQHTAALIRMSQIYGTHLVY